MKLVSLSLVFFFFVGAVSAQSLQSGNSSREVERSQFRQRVQNFVKKLDLNEEQKAFLKDFRKRRQQLGEQQRELAAKRQELNELMRSSSVDRGDVLYAAQELNALQSEVNLGRVTNMLDLKEKLNEEQVRKIMGAMRRMQESAREGRGFAGERGPGGGQMSRVPRRFAGGPRGEGPERFRQGPRPEGERGFAGGGRRLQAPEYRKPDDSRRERAEGPPHEGWGW